VAVVLAHLSYSKQNKQMCDKNARSADDIAAAAKSEDA